MEGKRTITPTAGVILYVGDNHKRKFAKASVYKHWTYPDIQSRMWNFTKAWNNVGSEM